MNESPMLDQVEPAPGGAVLRASGVSVDEVVKRLEGGESPGHVRESLGLSPAAILAALAHAACGDARALGPALVQAPPVRPALQRALTESALAGLFPKASPRARLNLAAGLLQINDFWEASHEAAQQADNMGERAFSAYWHGIAHRREPDAGNASYWFRRVGRHRVFETLESRARPLIDAAALAVAQQVLRGGCWEPFAFIELCVSARPGSPEERLARKLQRIEMLALLDATLADLDRA